MVFLVPQTFMEGFRKAREEEESNSVKRAAKKEEEVAEAEKVSYLIFLGAVFLQEGRYLLRSSFAKILTFVRVEA